VMKINHFSSREFIERGGRIPAPVIGVRN